MIPPRRRPARTRTALAAGALAAAVAVLYRPYLSLATLTTGGDMANLFYPLLTWVHDCIARDGAWPLWNPFLFCGHPAAAAAQTMVFHPPARLIYLLAGGWPVAALNLFIFAHVLWAGSGAWGFARARSGMGLRGTAAPWAAGVVFAGGAWWWGQVEHAAALATTAWLPWLVWTAGRAAQSPGWRTATAFGVVLALQILGGHPQEAFYSLIAAGGWALHRATTGEGRDRARFKGGPGARLRRAAGALLLGGVLAGGLAAVQLLPTLELGEHSYRRYDTPDYAASYSMPPRLLIMAALPHPFGSYATGYSESYAFGEYGIYVGIPALLLAVFGWGVHRRGGRWLGRCFGRRRDEDSVRASGGGDGGRYSGSVKRRPPLRGASAAWGCLAVVAVVLALGGNADLRKIVAPSRVEAARSPEFPEPGWSPLALMTRVVPPVRHFRVPARVLVVWTFAVAMLAATGVRAVESRLRLAAWRSATRGQGARRKGTFPFGRGARCTVVWALGGAIFLSLWLPSRQSRMAFQANYHEAFFAAEGMRPPIPDDDPLQNRLFRLTVLDHGLVMRDADSAPTGAPDDPDLETRVAFRAGILYPNTNMQYGVSMVEGYEEGLLPTVRLKDFLFAFNRSFRDADPDARLLALGGVRWLWSDLPIRSETWERVRPRSAMQYGTLYRNRLWRGTAFDPAEFPGVEWTALDGPAMRGAPPAPTRHTERLPYTLATEPETEAEATAASADPLATASGTAPAPPPMAASEARTPPSAETTEPLWRAELAGPNAVRLTRSRMIREEADGRRESGGQVGRVGRVGRVGPGEKGEEGESAEAGGPGGRVGQVGQVGQVGPGESGEFPSATSSVALPHLESAPASAPESAPESADPSTRGDFSSASADPFAASADPFAASAGLPGDSFARLVVAQATHPGWVARDDAGRRLPLRALNAWNTEIAIPPATTRIGLAYEPWSFRFGAFLSLMAVGMVSLAMGSALGGCGLRPSPRNRTGKGTEASRR